MSDRRSVWGIRHRLVSALRLAVVLAASLPAVEAAGQTPSRVTSELGHIEERTGRPAPRPAAEPEIAIPEHARTAPSGDGRRTFVLSAVSIEGATSFALGEFAPLYEPLLGRPIGLDGIGKLLDAITAKYKAAGYFLSRATAPPQDLDIGLLQIQVIEGHVEKVVIDGAVPDRWGLLKAYGDKIAAETPLRLSTLERYILFMQDIAGLTVEPVLAEAVEGSGAYTLTLSVTRHRVDGYASFDNRGTDSVGPLLAGGQVGVNSPLGLFGRTQVDAYTVPDRPQELIYGKFRHETPVGSEGTHIWLAASHSQIDTENPDTGADVESWFQRFAVGVWHPVLRRRSQSLRLTGRFERDESKRNEVGGGFRDVLSVAGAGVRYSFADPMGGSTIAFAEYSRGIDVLGAEDTAPGGRSRAGGETSFDKYVLDLNREQRIFDNLTLQLDARGQYSADTLLSSEEFVVGGARFGRAFDPAEVAGSVGAAASVELRLRLPIGTPDWSVWVYSAGDWGLVDPSSGPSDRVSSAALGMRLFALNAIVAELQAAAPLQLSDAPSHGRGFRFFFSLSAAI